MAFLFVRKLDSLPASGRMLSSVRPMSTFRIQEFARLAGVTVRALHHYDRLGLLSPVHRSDRGYRLYDHADLSRLERILVFRYLGVPLREIGPLLNAGDERGDTLLRTLARQQAALKARRHGLEAVLRAIEHAQSQARNSAEPEWLLTQTILKEIHMQETTHWTEKYYSPEAVETLRERREHFTVEHQQEIGARWQALYAEIQQLLERQVSPDSAEGRAIVARWMRLADEFTQGDRQIGEGLQRLLKDKDAWPDDETAAKMKERMPKPEHQAFFDAAVQACLRHG